MSHRCFVSFKKEDAVYKDAIVAKLTVENIVGNALDRWIDSENFMLNPDAYIDKAFEKRDMPVREKISIRNLR